MGAMLRVLVVCALLSTLTSLAGGCERGTQTQAPVPVSGPVSAAGWVAFEENGMYGYRDAAGKVTVPPRFKMAYDAEGALACAVDDGWVCIDGRGEVALRPFVFDNGPDPFVAGRARHIEGDLYGFHDLQGVKVIPARFDFVTPFSEGRAAFCSGCKKVCEAEGSPCRQEGGKWGYIDLQGQPIADAIYERAEPFADGRAQVTLQGAEMAIDPQGKPLPPGAAP